MTEKELRDRFEDLTLDPGAFSHEQHVRLAWTYLRDLPLPEVLRSFPESLRRFTMAAGAPEKYNEAMTVSYLIMIAERIERCRERASWPRFLERNRDLLSLDLLERLRSASSDPATAGTARPPAEKNLQGWEA